MKKGTFVVFLAGALLLPPIAFSQQKAVNKYTGVKVCAPCHKGEKKGNVLEIWQKSKHANAYKTLLTEVSAKIATEKGLTKPAHESPECLVCHVPTYNLDKALFTPTFDPKDGVQCETCHGAGSNYKSMQVMKDRAKAIAAGLIFQATEEEIEQSCLTCHNEKSPTFKGFKFQEDWAKIKHTVPK